MKAITSRRFGTLSAEVLERSLFFALLVDDICFGGCNRGLACCILS